MQADLSYFPVVFLATTIIIAVVVIGVRANRAETLHGGAPFWVFVFVWTITASFCGLLWAAYYSRFAGNLAISLLAILSAIYCAYLAAKWFARR